MFGGIVQQMLLPDDIVEMGRTIPLLDVELYNVARVSSEGHTWTYKPRVLMYR
jgi:hypothetical protein